MSRIAMPSQRREQLGADSQSIKEAKEVISKVPKYKKQPTYKYLGNVDTLSGQTFIWLVLGCIEADFARKCSSLNDLSAFFEIYKF